MRLSLKAKVLSLAVVPVLLFAVVISLTTVWILQGQARNEVDETRQRLLGLGFDPQLAVHVFLMDFHGFYGDFQLTGDFFTGATAEHQTPDIELAGRQPMAGSMTAKRSARQ